jgi:hypothetical protein
MCASVDVCRRVARANESLNVDRKNGLEVRRLADQVEIGFAGDSLAILAVEVERGSEFPHGLGDIAGQRPVTSQIVMRNRAFRFESNRVLQRFNREVDSVDTLVAPAESQQGVEAFRVEPRRLFEAVDCFRVAAGKAVSLSLEKQDVGLESLGIRNLTQTRNRSVGQSHPQFRIELPTVLKQRNQLEIAFGFPDDLFAADSFDVGHVWFDYAYGFVESRQQAVVCTRQESFVSRPCSRPCIVCSSN